MMRADQSWLGNVINAFDAGHVAGRDGMEHGEISRMLFAVEAFAEGFQDSIGAAQAGRGIDGDGCAIGDIFYGFCGADNFGHLSVAADQVRGPFCHGDGGGVGI